jgi:hypothetical protein
MKGKTREHIPISMISESWVKIVCWFTTGRWWRSFYTGLFIKRIGLHRNFPFIIIFLYFFRVWVDNFWIVVWPYIIYDRFLSWFIWINWHSWGVHPYFKKKLSCERLLEYFKINIHIYKKDKVLLWSSFHDNLLMVFWDMGGIFLKSYMALQSF